MWLSFALSFARQIPRRWRALSQLLAWLIGLELVSPPGLFQYPPFRAGIRNLGLVAVIGLLAILIRWIAGSAGGDDASSPSTGGRDSEIQARENENLAATIRHDPEVSTTSKCPVIASEPDCSIIVTLVHGTSQPRWFSWFGPKRSGADEHGWVRAESKFSEDLIKNAPRGIQVRPFFWSGENSHHSRVTAAEQLQMHLRHLKRDFPDSEQICVGHSHGGSVIYYALRDSSTEDSLLGYAFLSTPFLDFQPRNFAHLDAAEFLIAGLAVLCVSLPSYVLALHNGWSFTAPLTGPNPTLIAILLSVPFALLVRIYRRITHQWKSAACEFLATLPNSFCSSDKALILRAPGDEASNGLALIYILTLLQIQAQLRAEAYFKQLDTKGRV